MVIQRNWKNSNPDALLQNSSSEDSSGSWQLQSSSRGVSSTQTSSSMPNGSNRNTINRQVALNTLAAMHRRYNLPGVIQSSGRPPAEYRASANKSLDILRQNIQTAVTKEIDQVIKKYLEKFFVPAVNNIRSNLGEESVGEEQVRAVCRAMLDGARCLYAAQPRPSVSAARHVASPSELSDSESSNGADSRFGRPSSSPSFGKRKESDTDSDIMIGARRKRRMEGVVCPAHKWDPSRLNQETLFIMGSVANKVLGLGQSRGRLYSKHAGLLRYPADSADKEWITNQNITTPAGGKTYIMVLEDIEELAVSEDYRNSPSLRLDELSGFRAPPFMLRKIQAYLSRHSEMSEDYASSTPTPTPPPAEIPRTQIKVEDIDDSSGSVQVKIEQAEDPLKEDPFKKIKVENESDDQYASSDQSIKLEQYDETMIKLENNVDNRKFLPSIGSFTSLVSSGISSTSATDSHNYWKGPSTSQNIADSSAKVDLNPATEFIDADIEFLSSDFCTYVESEADVKKSFDRISDGGAGDLFMSNDNNSTTISTSSTSGAITRPVNSSQTTQESAVCKPGIVTSFVGSITVSSMPSNIVHTYVTTTVASTMGKSTVTTTQLSSPPVFSIPSNQVTFAQAVNSFPQSSSSQVITHIQTSGSNNTITLQPNMVQPTTRTVYSLASTPKTLNTALTPGSTIIGFGTRPTIAGSIINTGNFINISTKSFSSGNILHNAIVSRNMINRGMNIARAELTRPTLANTTGTSKPLVVTSSGSSISYPRSSASLPSKIDLNDDASITTTKAIIDNTCNSSAMLKKVLTLGSAGVNKTFLSPPTQKASNSRVTSASSSSNLSASHATLSALLSGVSDCTHSDKKNSFSVSQTDK